MSESRQEERVENRPPRSLVVAVWALLSCFWVFCAVSSFLPGARLWGINHLAFYAWPVRALALAVMAVSFLPQARRAVLRWIESSSGLFSRRRRLVAAGLSIAAFVLFNAFAASTQLLGDGLYVGNNVERAAKVDPGTFAKVLKTPDPIYPGTEMLYLAVTRAASNELGVSPIAVLRVVIALFGALLVFFVVASHAPRRSPPGTLLAPSPGITPLVVLAFLSGAVQIFFGYVEVYAPLMFFAALFTVSARRTIHGSAGLELPIVTALAALGMHRLGLVLLPALGVLVLWVACGRQKSRLFARGVYALAAATLTAPMLAAWSGRLGGSILPMTTRERAYAVLSGSHLADVANEILLVFPGFFVLAGIVILMRITRARPANGGHGAAPIAPPLVPSEGTRSQTGFPDVLFGIFLAGPVLMFLFFFKPELGMARDWDLFAIAGLGLWAPVAVALDRARWNAPTRALVDAVWPSVLVVTAVLTAAWIGINADAGRSVARFESILVYDRTHAAYAYETLASHHNARKDFPSEVKALEDAVAASQNPRLLLTLGLRYHDAGQKEKAVSTLQTCLLIKPDYDEARKSLLQMLLFMGRDDDMLVVCEEGARLAPDDSYYPLFQGMAYVRQGRDSDARRAFDRCLELRPSPEVASRIDEFLRSLPPAADEDRSKGEETEGKP